ncbi:MAG: BON domain-containing protein [Neorhizobium sp.]|nr:BON domain-containing protein [Neorhizobium sp.]
MTMVYKNREFHEAPPAMDGEYPPQATLEIAVSDALGIAGGVDAAHVTVVAEGSVVTLTGTVLYPQEVARAAEVAAAIAGVTEVRNAIRAVEPQPSRGL